MLRPRVIPCLLLNRGGGLVKTTRFASPVYVGDPINVVKIFNDKEVDELVLLDIEASRDRRGPNVELLARICREAFMPLAYGGGVRALDDVKRIIGLGFEKVVLNTTALEDPSFITRAAAACGSQSVVVSIDAKRDLLGRAWVYSHARAKATSTTPRDHALAAVRAGAGELIVGAVDRDGTMSGYDLELVTTVASAVDVPVVAIGGAASGDDLARAIAAGASAAAAGAMFVFHGKRRAVLISYPDAATLAQVFRR